MAEQPCIPVFVKLDYWDTYRAAVTLSARQGRKVLTIYAVMAVLTLTLSVFVLLNPRPGKDWYEMGLNAKPLLWVFAFPVLIVLVLPLLSARKTVGDERVRAGFDYEFSQDSIHVRSSVSKSELQWTAFRDATETGSAFLLFQTTGLANIIPRKCFANSTDISAMRALLRDKFPNAKLRRD